MTNLNLPDQAQAELLNITIEEASEVVKACTKILRHGWDAKSPFEKYGNNTEDLEQEIGDFLTAVLLLVRNDCISRGAIRAAMEAKMRSLENWVHFQDTTNMYEVFAHERII